VKKVKGPLTYNLRTRRPLKMREGIPERESQKVTSRAIHKQIWFNEKRLVGVIGERKLKNQNRFRKQKGGKETKSPVAYRKNKKKGYWDYKKKD